MIKRKRKKTGPTLQLLIDGQNKKRTGLTAVYHLDFEGTVSAAQSCSEIAGNTVIVPVAVKNSQTATPGQINLLKCLGYHREWIYSGGENIVF